MNIESFLKDLKNQAKQTITYELSPDKSASLDSLATKVLESKLLNHIDGFVCTDSPLAKMRQSSLLSSIKFQALFNKPVVCTTSLRDRNSLALSSMMLGAHSFDIRLFLALSGDALKLGDQPQAKSVFEGSSLKILELINALNKGFDLGGNPLKHPLVTPIYAFSTISSYAKNKTLLKKSLESKIALGTKAIITQPVYDIETLKELLEWVDEINAKYSTDAILIFGFFPVLSLKSAIYLNTKLPGVFVPESLIVKMEEASLSGSEKEVGFELSLKLLESLLGLHKKCHFMNGNNANLASSMLASIK
ncbi:methylenetetrahydrofolate reductase [Helicobacter sp. 11S02629-2]|uniref:methylenetetrahydrofolate reductase n=1 Tax=Helicobacter sp. 11S02629-2 TaxID=1476195 RepID=UPI000BA4F504|nr:methylenetetrahydrofolate reductase [Helicobacter sp. 11S02629-2]PAF44968.1 hypothetical protein BKH40_04595 [Helicobacter sp. 11S02629-2]